MKLTISKHAKDATYISLYGTNLPVDKYNDIYRYIEPTIKQDLG